MASNPPVMDTTPVGSVVKCGKRVLGAWGLMMSTAPFTHILHPTPFHSSGWGRRRLSPQELGDLWNVPLLMQDWFVARSRTASLSNFLRSCPAKILMVGATTLVECYGLSGGGKEPHGISAQLREGGGPDGAWRTLVLQARAIALKSKYRAITLEKERSEVILKQDCQKRDDAEVPAHLWAKHLEDTRLTHLGPMPKGWEEKVEPMRMLML